MVISQEVLSKAEEIADQVSLFVFFFFSLLFNLIYNFILTLTRIKKAQTHKKY